MKRNEVLELLDYKIVLEEQKECPNEDVITALSEAMFLIAMLDDIEEGYKEEDEEENTCYFCGEPIMECICDCDNCDNCDECTCCNSPEDIEVTDEEFDELVADVFTRLLIDNNLQ